ncbi:MAG: glycosyltransferase family 2 protein [Proteobacteria bacterium]|nr:glycosyltransferase family 2 protein [Pseudomonadota bacterium]NBP13676.1 glycosyltransferase family 2 protein [bacterium]
MEKLLTIGMATYDDYDGVFFTTQSLRMHHSICNSPDVEFVILDNNPSSEYGQEVQRYVNNALGNKCKYIQKSDKCSSFNKYSIVDHASGKYVLILDCHILLVQNALNYLLEYYANNPDCKDLVQGPLIYDDLINYATEFDTKWSGDMYGVWHTNKIAHDLGNPFEIKMQGMGLCSFERANWPQISPHFRGFGAEEGYIAEKFRRNGGRNICIPQLKWMHRFGRPCGVKYPLILEDRIWNYFIGWLEITKDPNHYMITDTYNHFKDKIPKYSIDNILAQAKELILQ